MVAIFNNRVHKFYCCLDRPYSEVGNVVFRAFAFSLADGKYDARTLSFVVRPVVDGLGFGVGSRGCPTGVGIGDPTVAAPI